MTSERALFQAFARAADGYARDAVVGAACNVLANALRQSHANLGEAVEELDDLVAKLKKALAQSHYLADGSKRVVIPHLRELFPEVSF